MEDESGLTGLTQSQRQARGGIEVQPDPADITREQEMGRWPDRDMLEAAHGLIANARDWLLLCTENDDLESVRWRKAARRWIDAYGEQLSRKRGMPGEESGS